jgi:hypothetical protein
VTWIIGVSIVLCGNFVFDWVNRPGIGMHYPKIISNKKTLQRSWIARASNILGEMNWHINPNNIHSPHRTMDTPIIQVTTTETFAHISKYTPNLIWMSSITNAEGTHIISQADWMKQQFRSNTPIYTKRKIYNTIRKTLMTKGKWNNTIHISKLKK